MFNPFKLAVVAITLSGWAVTASAAPLSYVTAGPDYILSGAPEIIENRVTATDRASVFFTQGVNFTRTGVLTQDLDLMTPDPDRRLPTGTQMFARERPKTGTNWCTVGESERDKICLYQESGAWVWRQNDTRLPARCLLILPCLLAPPKNDPVLQLPVDAPEIKPLAPANPPQFLARITIKTSGNNGFQIKSSCAAPKTEPDGKMTAVYCYRTMYVSKKEMSTGQVYAGSDNTGALLRYDAQDGTISVTRVALDPATGQVIP